MKRAEQSGWFAPISKLLRLATPARSKAAIHSDSASQEELLPAPALEHTHDVAVEHCSQAVSSDLEADRESSTLQDAAAAGVLPAEARQLPVIAISEEGQLQEPDEAMAVVTHNEPIADHTPERKNWAQADEKMVAAEHERQVWPSCLLQHGEGPKEAQLQKPGEVMAVTEQSEMEIPELPQLVREADSSVATSLGTQVMQSVGPTSLTSVVTAAPDFSNTLLYAGALNELPLEEAAKERQRLWGGKDLLSLVQALNGAATSTPWSLEVLHRAFQKEHEALLASNAPKFGRSTSDVESHFNPAPCVTVGDFLVAGRGDAAQQPVQVRVGKDGSLDVFLQEADATWSYFPGRFELEQLETSASQLCWRFAIACDNGLSWNGMLAGNTFHGNRFSFNIVRSRATTIAANTANAESLALDEAWPVCYNVLSRTSSCEELDTGIKQFKKWQCEFEGLKDRFERCKAEQLVLFVGSSGSGKSKLINSILGDDILPSAGEGSAVTAAPVELRYKAALCESSDVPPGQVMRYEVEFELYSLDEFVEKRTQMEGELIRYWRVQAEEKARLKEEYKRKRAQKACKKTKTRRGRNVSESTSEDDEDDESAEAVPARKPPLHEDDAQFAREAHDWFEACYGKNAFVHGWQSSDEFHKSFSKLPSKLNSQTKYQLAMSNEVQALLCQWLVHDSARDEEGQLWPLVRIARVASAWEMLSPGLVFEDLPGTGDLNAVRNKIAQQEFRRADYVVICSRADRAATDRAALEWLHKALRDLVPDSSAYVATKCDDVSKDEIVRDHKMRHNASKTDAACRRNETVKKLITREHGALAFTTSAKDYCRCIGLDAAHPETFMTQESTEVPSLRSTIIKTLTERKAKCRRDLIEELKVQLQVVTAHTFEISLDDLDLPAMKVKFEGLVQRCFVAKLQDIADTFQQELVSDQKRIKKIVSTGRKEAEKGIPSKSRHYGTGTGLRWNTHKALIDRNGDFRDTSIAGEIAKPMLDTLEGHCRTFFNSLPARLEKMVDCFIETGTSFMESEVSKMLAGQPAMAQHAKELGSLTLEKLRIHLRCQLSEFNEQQQEQRQGYAEESQESVRVELARHLRDAKNNYSGTGSFNGRKQSVTNNIPEMDLEDCAKPPKQRVNQVVDTFADLKGKLSAASAEMICDALADLWDGSRASSAEAVQSRAALRSMLEDEQVKLAPFLRDAKIGDLLPSS